MTARVLILNTPNPAGQAQLKAYGERVRPLLAAAQAKVLFRSDDLTTVAGSLNSKNAMVLEFPSRADAESFFEQEAYQALIPLRSAGFQQLEIAILA